MKTIRTHYLNWRVLPERDLVDLSALLQNGIVERCRDLWDRGLYVAGPIETPDSSADPPIAVCEFLWRKYNRDDRPDGQTRRSMSIGDVVEVGSSFFVVVAIGWLALWDNEPKSIARSALLWLRRDEQGLNCPDCGLYWGEHYCHVYSCMEQAWGLYEDTPLCRAHAIGTSRLNIAPDVMVSLSREEGAVEERK